MSAHRTLTLPDPAPGLSTPVEWDITPDDRRAARDMADTRSPYGIRVVSTIVLRRLVDGSSTADYVLTPGALRVLADLAQDELWRREDLDAAATLATPEGRISQGRPTANPTLGQSNRRDGMVLATNFLRW